MAKLTLKELEQRNSDLQVTVDQQAQQLQQIQPSSLQHQMLQSKHLL